MHGFSSVVWFARSLLQLLVRYAVIETLPFWCCLVLRKGQRVNTFSLNIDQSKIWCEEKGKLTIPRSISKSQPSPSVREHDVSAKVEVRPGRHLGFALRLTGENI